MKILFKTIISFWQISLTLGLLNFLKLIFYFLYWKLVNKKLFKFKFNFKGIKFKFYCDNRVDLAAISEIFINREYEYKYIEMEEGGGKVIFDLGANIGDTAIFYAINFPEAIIYAIEPNPVIHEKLILNTKQFPNIKVHRCAISDTTGKIKLNFGDSHLGSSIKDRLINTSSVEVSTYSLRDFCQKENIIKIDILKFDIEGAEENLLKDINFIKENVLQLVGEIHDDLTSISMSMVIDNLKLKNQEKKVLNKSRYIIFGTL